MPAAHQWHSCIACYTDVPDSGAKVLRAQCVACKIVEGNPLNFRDLKVKVDFALSCPSAFAIPSAPVRCSGLTAIAKWVENFRVFYSCSVSDVSVH